MPADPGSLAVLSAYRDSGYPDLLDALQAARSSFDTWDDPRYWLVTAIIDAHITESVGQALCYALGDEYPLRPSHELVFAAGMKLDEVAS